MNADETGATLVEYALLIALVAVIVFAFMVALDEEVARALCSVVPALGGICP